MTTTTNFRTCPSTGLKIDLNAERLIKANAVVAVVFLAVGGFFGLLVALTRWPAVHLLPADWFYLALTGHGLDVLIVWIIFFEIAVLYFASAILLNSRLATPRWAWAGFAMMLVGAVMANIAVLQGNSSVMFTSYVPMKAAPHFYLGFILFAVGALIGCFVFFGTLVVARAEKTYEGSVPLVTFGATTAAIIAVFTIASGAIILIPTLLWSMGLIGDIDTLMYKTIWWAMGHSSQQINVAAHVSIWYLIAALLLGARTLSEKVSRMAFLMYILFLQLASAHHLLAEPGLSSEWKIFNTSYAMYLAVLGSMIHGMTVPGSIEAAQRARGYTRGLFEWIRKAPWGNPAFSGMFMSLVMFGFLGGISGVVMGAEQINLIMHNTLYVPGHFHATVVAGTTLTFMAVTYLLVPLIFRRELVLKPLAKIQPYVFGIGVAGISFFMMGAGTLGVARRHWDITFADATFSFDFPGTAFLMLGLNGLSAILAAVGGLIYVVVVVGSILFGRKIGDDEAVLEVPTVAASTYGSAKSVSIPGTVALVTVFFTVFVLYYFVNWKYLAEVWPLR
ncbi:MAG: cytochrome C oxidase subunit I [Acidiferrobacteraceae bacterium]|jgi:cytochrome c oxidase subunit 1|nr:cytochrome C oxidase subunit I [Acidiferrobacteraceae bacterium]MBT3768447.1 cytochrome C oxidase subunit I [Acidiferrobacteraceae bacterium]MBT3972955.1 cytochrome C oxidase subunit I [Acidiferrobacteraceae bacterium]MBT4396496.1 cytochrome C oxidase subunit I [Acidiferrobacteraceae bacterium]MBT4406048.1 cytochrome C oxidase subunit I [Acidiferrobacteraceae bacterium]